MIGPSGWFGDLSAAVPSGQTAAALALAGGAPALDSQSGGNLSLGPQLLCAITGTPRWQEPELRELSATRGHAAALAVAWQTHGVDFLQHLHGAFALAIIDLEAQQALLAIDRSGIQTLYYATPDERGIAFAPTPFGLASHPALTAEIAPQALLNYLQFWWIPSPSAIYSGQSKLQPAQYILHDGKAGSTVAKTYWSMPYRQHGTANETELAEELAERLRVAVARDLGDCDPQMAGAFLSGGLDSSTISGLLGKVTGTPARTYTIGFGDDEFDESGYADIVARHFGTRHHHYRMAADDFFSAIPAIVTHAPEPFSNSSIVPVYWCARRAQEDGVRLMLAGDGGDELFAGNARYASEMVFEHYRHVPALLRGALETILPALPSIDAIPLLRKARNYVNYAKIPLPDRLLATNFFASANLNDVFCEDAARHLDAGGPLKLMRQAYHSPASEDAVQRLMHLDLKLILADGDLRKVNIGCDAAGVDVRYPFMDDDVVAFAAQIPSHILMRDNKLRAFYKSAFASFLPPQTTAKKKHGFGMPTMRWMKQCAPLEQMALDSVRDFSRRGLLKPAFLDRVVAEYRAAESETQASGLLCDIMLLEQWLQAHV